MVIGKDGLAANGKPPIPQIAEERFWIAETAKRKERAEANFTCGKWSNFATESAESKQPSRRGENRILIELSDRLERSR